MTARPISRRTLLRGAGAALAIPWLEAMVPSRVFAGGGALATAPLRMGIYTVAGGTVIESWKPGAAGALDKLPSILRPLEAHKNDLLVLSGLAHHGDAENVNAHEHCAFLHLTGGTKVGKIDGKPQAPVSIDQLAAERIGHQTFLPSLELATERSNERRYSFRTSGEPVSYEDNPRIAFDRMFRGRTPRVPDRSRTAEPATAGPAKDSLERSVLDLVMEDAKRLQRKVGSTDRRKLDQYLESVSSLERRVALIEAQASQMAQDGAGKEAPIPGELPETPDAYGEIQRASDTDPEIQARYIDLMSDLMVLAFQTDCTRIATFAVGSDGSLFPGVVTVGFERHFHTLEHQGGNPDPRRADPLAREACRQVSHWYIQQFARTVEKMKAIDEGGVSLLDNTMLLFTSYMADGGHHRQDFPTLLVGNAQGSLKTGRHVAYPMGTPMSNLYVEMLDRLGAGVAEFGESKTSPAAAFGGRLPNLV
jgi:hypothetical protein